MPYTDSGRIIKMTGGLYTVQLDPPPADATTPTPGPLAGHAVECRARGQFRHAHITPLVGDRVTVRYDDSSPTAAPAGGAVTVTPGKDRAGLAITDILPRRNSLIRPPLANVDVMLVVVAAAAPDPDIPTVDKLLSILAFHHIRPVLVIGKCDLNPARAAALQETYTRVGYEVFVLSCHTGEGVADFARYAAGGFGTRAASEATAEDTTAVRATAEDPATGNTDHVIGTPVVAVAGASGAGKSTLLNTLFPGLSLVTGSISEKIGRGKNTTRHTELFPLPASSGENASADKDFSGAHGYIADTAGFSLLDFERFDFFALEDLPHTFPEFEPLLGHCRYTDCTHLTDEGCAILEAVRDGRIPASRHAAYRELYATLKEKKKW